MLARAAVEAFAVFTAAAALGFACEALADRKLFLLHRIPIAAMDGDPLSSSAPRGQHGWLHVPLCVVDMVLVLSSSADWQDSSRWSSFRGPLWGPVASFFVCAFTVLPAVLAGWLLWLPPQCSPLASLWVTPWTEQRGKLYLYYACCATVEMRAHSQGCMTPQLCVAFVFVAQFVWLVVF